jgi:hypothetical protein
MLQETWIQCCGGIFGLFFLCPTASAQNVSLADVAWNTGQCCSGKFPTSIWRLICLYPTVVEVSVASTRSGHPAASNSYFLLKNIHEIMIRSVMKKIDRWDGSRVGWITCKTCTPNENVCHHLLLNMMLGYHGIKKICNINFLLSLVWSSIYIKHVRVL